MELIFKKSWQSEKGFSDVKFLSSTRGHEGFWTIDPFAFPQLLQAGIRNSWSDPRPAQHWFGRGLGPTFPRLFLANRNSLWDVQCTGIRAISGLQMFVTR